MRPLALALLLCACGAPDPARRCNGQEALCDRAFDAVAMAGTHNSMASDDDGFVSPNQTYGLRRQLDDGIRSLMLDVHAWRGGTYLCHGACELGSKPLVDGLTEIAAFLDTRPYEVLSIIFQDEVPVADIAGALQQSGLAGHAWQGDPTGGWPTLGEMIDDGGRLLVTMERGRAPPSWVHNFWDLGFDTPYSFASAAAFTCDLNRGAADNSLFLVNHWVSDPLASFDNATEVNTRAVLEPRVEQCRAERGQLPNIVAVDFYETGDLFAVVDEINGW